MPSLPSARLLLRLLLALLLAVNGIAPALAAGVMPPAAPAAAEATVKAHAAMAMAMAGEATDCHDIAAGPAAPVADTTMVDTPVAAESAACCDDDPCNGAGCDCACMALAAALPMPIAPAWAATLRAAPSRVIAPLHASPPPTGVTRPPIA